MSGEEARAIAPGERLPSLALARADGSGAVSIRGPARSAVVVVLLSHTDDAVRDVLGELTAQEERFRLWGGRVSVVLPPDTPVEQGRTLARELAPLVVLEDPEGAARTCLGLPRERAALLIADRWGQLYHVEAADAVAELGAPDEIEEWLRYLATQCAECGVLDEPGHGEWAH